MFLLELSQFGSFCMLDETLMISHVNYSEKNAEISLTYQKEKMIDAYNLKPKYFLMKYERVTMFVFILCVLKWKNLN